MALGISAFLDLLILERQVTEGKAVSDLKDAVLKMRREENNLPYYTDDEARWDFVSGQNCGHDSIDAG